VADRVAAYAPRMPNINDPIFEEPREHPGFRCLRARVGRKAGCERLGLSLWELPPGEAAYPYHYHLAEEELLLVLTGRPSLRTPDGWRDLAQGEVVAFLRGEQGAHQLLNRTEQTVRFLAFSTNGDPDVVIYPTRASSARSSASHRAAGCARCSASPTPSTTTTASNRQTGPQPMRTPSDRFCSENAFAERWVRRRLVVTATHVA
jgi:uncharacterized cupin superfamily protein